MTDARLSHTDATGDETVPLGAARPPWSLALSGRTATPSDRMAQLSQSLALEASVQGSRGAAETWFERRLRCDTA